MSSKVTRRKFMQGAAAVAPLALAAPAFAQSAASSSKTQAGGDKFDVVVVGAGHNSLITACYMQMAGYRCVVLEGRPQIGGGAKTAELTLRGFKHDVCSANHGAIVSNPAMKELKLAEYGLEYLTSDPVNTVMLDDGQTLTEWKDLDRTVEGIAKYSKKDADTYRRMAMESSNFPREMEAAFSDGMPIGWQAPAPHVEKKLSPGLLRRAKMSMWAVINHSFEHPYVRTFMVGGWPVGLNADNRGMSAYPSAKPAGPSTPKGGAGMLSIALGRCFEAHGGVILTNKPAVELIIEGGKCTGVECSDGSQYRASKAVISTVHIKRLVDMAPKAMWGDEFLDGVDTFQTGSSGLNTLYACKEPIIFPDAGGSGVVNPGPVHAHSLWNMERCLRFDMELITGDVNPDDPQPVLHIVQPSVDRSVARTRGLPHRARPRTSALQPAQGRPRALGRDQGTGGGQPSARHPADGQELHRRQDPRPVHHVARRSRAHEPGHVSRLLPRRHGRSGTGRRPAAGAGLGTAPDADPGSLSDRRHDPPRRRRGRTAWTECRDGDPEGLRHQHRRSRHEDLARSRPKQVGTERSAPSR